MMTVIHGRGRIDKMELPFHKKDAGAGTNHAKNRTAEFNGINVLFLLKGCGWVAPSVSDYRGYNMAIKPI